MCLQPYHVPATRHRPTAPAALAPAFGSMTVTDPAGPALVEPWASHDIAPHWPKWLWERHDFQHAYNLPLADYCLDALAKPYEARSHVECLKISEWLQHVPWLRSLPEGIRAALMRGANGVKYPANALIYSRGSLGSCMYILVEGTCQATAQKGLMGIQPAKYESGTLIGGRSHHYCLDHSLVVHYFPVGNFFIHRLYKKPLTF